MPLTGADDLGRPMRQDELGQLARAFNGCVARLRAALQTQRQFMADASHELRTPVSIIRTAADVALSREHRDEAEYREALAIAGAQSRRLGTLVDDMLVLARADAGGYPLRCVDFYLDDVGRRVPAGGRACWPRTRGVTVAATGATDVVGPWRRGAAAAAAAQPAAERRPAHAGRRRRHRVDVVPARLRGVASRVTDSGAGIPPEPIGHGSSSGSCSSIRRAAAKGPGLGLTIAQWIAEAHGGSLSVASTGPGGTTFCVTLPAASTTGAAAPAPLAAHETTVAAPV